MLGTFDTEAMHEAAHTAHGTSHGKTSDSNTDPANAAFATTLATMLNVTPQQLAKMTAQHPEGADSELEQTAGDRPGRPNTTSPIAAFDVSSARDASAKGAQLQTAPLVAPHTMTVTVDDAYRPTAELPSVVTGLSSVIGETRMGGAPSALGRPERAIAAPATSETTTATPEHATTDLLTGENTTIENATLVARTTAASVAAANLGKPAYAATHGVREAANVAAATNANTINSDPNALDPEFRARLGRVVSRMQNEYGHSVEIVEGYRPQDRQNHLYEQGRTNPGDVVTWTKSSKHTLGMAADVKIDGSYNNPEAYKQFARIAAQEGLRTLGARDPGHVELPTRAGAAAWGTTTDSVGNDAGVSRAVGLILAQQEQTNDSQSSTDADSFNSLLSRASRISGAQATSGLETRAAVTAVDAQSPNGNQFSDLLSRGGMGRTVNRAPAAGINAVAADRGKDAAPQRANATGPAGVAQVAQVATVASVAQVATIAGIARAGATFTAHSSTPVTAAVPSTGAAAAERVGQVLDVRDATPARPLSHMTLSLDNANGGTDHIRIDMRGSSVHTAISLGDHVGADKMSLRVGELQHALEQQGLEPGSIRVATTAADTGAGGSSRHNGDGFAQAQDRQPDTHRGTNRQDADDPQHGAQRQRAQRGKHGGK